MFLGNGIDIQGFAAIAAIQVDKTDLFQDLENFTTDVGRLLDDGGLRWSRHGLARKVSKHGKQLRNLVRMLTQLGLVVSQSLIMLCKLFPELCQGVVVCYKKF